MAPEVQGSGGDPPSAGLHNAAFLGRCMSAMIYGDEDIWQRRYMAAKVYGTGGDPPSAG